MNYYDRMEEIKDITLQNILDFLYERRDEDKMFWASYIKLSNYQDLVEIMKNFIEKNINY
jgi:hypothetical protein